jgi:uncharacterized membrane protein
MMKYLAGFGGAALAIVVLDALWLTFAGPRIYRPMIGEILADKVRMAPAVVFYCLYVLGIFVLAVRPAIRSGQWTEALWLGLIVGLVAYGCYDLTNQATLKVWSINITLIDIAWGALLSATGAVAGFFASRLLAK